MVEEKVKSILAQVLGIGERVSALNAQTQLLGGIPDFDSMAVVSVLTVIEEEFGFMIDDDEVSAETFETIGALVDFVEKKLGS